MFHRETRYFAKVGPENTPACQELLEKAVASLTDEAAATSRSTPERLSAVFPATSAGLSPDTTSPISPPFRKKNKLQHSPV